MTNTNGVIEHLREICIDVLGEQAERPLKMLSETKNNSHEILQTCKQIEDYTRELIDTRKASEIAQMMRRILMNEVIRKMDNND